MQRYWMCITDNGTRPPKYQHASKEVAIDEAKRLLQTTDASEVTIVEAVAAVKFTTEEATDEGTCPFPVHKGEKCLCLTCKKKAICGRCTYMGTCGERCRVDNAQNQCSAYEKEE